MTLCLRFTRALGRLIATFPLPNIVRVKIRAHITFPLLTVELRFWVARRLVNVGIAFHHIRSLIRVLTGDVTVARITIVRRVSR